MSFFTHLLAPDVVPTPFLSIVAECFLWSAPAAVVVMIVIRLGWRRGKGLEDI